MVICLPKNPESGLMSITSQTSVVCMGKPKKVIVSLGHTQLSIYQLVWIVDPSVIQMKAFESCLLKHHPSHLTLVSDYFM